MTPNTYLTRQRDGRAQLLRVMSVTSPLCTVAPCQSVETTQGAMPGPWSSPSLPLPIALYSSWSSWNWLPVANDASDMFAPNTGMVDPPMQPKPIGAPAVPAPEAGDMTDSEPVPFGAKHRGHPSILLALQCARYFKPLAFHGFPLA